MEHLYKSWLSPATHAAPVNWSTKIFLVSYVNKPLLGTLNRVNLNFSPTLINLAVRLKSEERQFYQISMWKWNSDNFSVTFEQQVWLKLVLERWAFNCHWIFKYPLFRYKGKIGYEQFQCTFNTHNYLQNWFCKQRIAVYPIVNLFRIQFDISWHIKPLNMFWSPCCTISTKQTKTNTGRSLAHAIDITRNSTWSHRGLACDTVYHIVWTTKRA